MSVKREILEALANYLEHHEGFKDFHGLQYYYDITTINANMDLPLICFNVGYNDDNSEQTGTNINLFCPRSYFNELEIRLHTKTQETDILMDEAWDFEEALMKCLNQPIIWEEIHPKLHNVKYTGTKPLTTMYYQAFRDDYEGEFVCNVCRVGYEIEYEL